MSDGRISLSLHRVLLCTAHACSMHHENHVRFILREEMDKSAHTKACGFYVHMALTRDRRFAECFCRDCRKSAWRYFLHNE